MIIHLKPNSLPNQIAQTAERLEAIYVKLGVKDVLIFSHKVKEVPESIADQVDEVFHFDNDIQLAAKSYRKKQAPIQLGKEQLGGNSQNTLMMAGPCSVESLDQITESASFLSGLGITTMRAGCFKPRTSPYTFQGLGQRGLELLSEMRTKYGLKIITEVKDSSHVNQVIEMADIVQIGTKAMYDQSILTACGKSSKPVLLKRGFGTTLQEFVQAAEFIMCRGNEQVILCERGIRTFETKTRFTLDLTGVAYLKEYTNLPIVVDPSHAMGYRYGVPDLARAAMAMGIDGLLIETHPNPAQAKSDADQQLDHGAFEELFASLGKVAMAVNRKLI